MKDTKQSKPAKSKISLIQKGWYIDNTWRLSLIQQTLCSKSIQVVLSTFRVISHPNWTRKVFLLHKAVILYLMANFSIKELDLLWSKLARDWLPPESWIFRNQNWQRKIQDLTGDSAFPKWIISDKRLQAPSRSESSQISDCRSLLGTRISCSSMFLLLMIKASTWKSGGILLFSFIKTKKLGAPYTAMQMKNELALSEEENVKLEFCSLSDINPRPIPVTHWG